MGENLDPEVKSATGRRTEEEAYITSAIRNAKSPNFEDEDFENAELMKYEKSNQFALGYYGMNRNSKKLMTAGLVLAWNCNRISRITEEEEANGVWVCASIPQVGKLMGFEAAPGESLKHRYVYQAVNDAADGVLNAKIKIVDPVTQSFDEFVIIDRILYNPNETGSVFFHINGGTCKHIINNKQSFTVYSLILNNYLDKNGTSVAADLYEILKTQYYKAKESEDGKYRFYIDYLDIRMKLNLINTNDPRIESLLRDRRFANYAKDERIACERIKEAMRFDEGIDKVHEGRKIKVMSYNDYKDFRRRVLTPTQDSFKKCLENYPSMMSFMFEYKPKRYAGMVVGIYFTIYTTEAYRKKQREEGVQMSLLDYADGDIDKTGLTAGVGADEEIISTYETVEDAYKASNEDVEKLISEEEKKKELAAERKKKKTEERNRPRELEEREGKLETIVRIDAFFKSVGESFTFEQMSTMADYGTSQDIMDKYKIMESAGKIRSKVGWIISALKENYCEPAPKKQKIDHGFKQNEYDWDELEKILVSNGPARKGGEEEN